VIRHNELTELDLTIAHGWTFKITSPFSGWHRARRGCVNVRVFFRETGNAGITGESGELISSMTPNRGDQPGKDHKHVQMHCG